jgi:hypothetical protein
VRAERLRGDVVKGVAELQRHLDLVAGHAAERARLEEQLRRQEGEIAVRCRTGGGGGGAWSPRRPEGSDNLVCRPPQTLRTDDRRLRLQEGRLQCEELLGSNDMIAAHLPVALWPRPGCPLRGRRAAPAARGTSRSVDGGPAG